MASSEGPHYTSTRKPRFTSPEEQLTVRQKGQMASVLENANFDGLDFTGTDFSFGILLNSSSKGTHFNGATLKDTHVRKVALDNADFSGVTVYSGGRWEGFPRSFRDRYEASVRHRLLATYRRFL
jgi:uncharacterized protein YjbI with pentapeptide repeats